MKKDLIIELISKTNKIELNLVTKAINIIESNKSLVIDDVFFVASILFLFSDYGIK